MDTAVLKSWCEFVRRTDPLIWALAVDSTSSSSQTENNIDSLILTSSPPSPSSPSLLASTSAATAAMTGSGSDTAAVDMTAAKTRMFSSFRNSHCKSLAVSEQPQNAIDWLKCLVQTTNTTHDDLHLKQDSHQHRLPRTMRRSVERGASKAPAGSLVVAMAMENVPKEEEAMISRRTTGASNELENAPTGSTSNTDTASGSTGSGPGSPSSSSSKASGSSTNTHQRKTTNNNHNNNSNNTYYTTTFNWMYYATEPAAASAAAAAAAASPSARFGSRNEDHAGTSSSTSSSGNAVGGVGGAIISPSIATAATAAVASHIAIEREALAGGASAAAAASAATAAVSSGAGELQGSESTNNSDTLANSNKSMDSTITNNTIASDSATATATTTTTTPSANNNNSNNKNTQSLPARFATLFPQASTITLDSTTQFLHSILLSSKEATTAFLYRTFSPTYRICTLYKTSFTDGSQLRGLARMKDSVMRADAVVLVKSSAGQMKDVWGMVMDAYGVKAKMAREKKRREEREKAVREGREIVEERIRSKKKISEAPPVTTTSTAAATATEVEVERWKSVGDEADDSSSSEGGMEGMDIGGGGLD